MVSSAAIHLLVLLSSAFSQDAPALPSDCRLRPISYGLYHSAAHVTYKTAVECCTSKGMEISKLKNKLLKEQMRDAILVETFGEEPIGPTSGIYIETDADNLDGFYPRHLEETINRILNGSNEIQPDICPIIYLESPQDIHLNITGVPCSNLQTFLCQSPTRFDRSVCKAINYVPLIGNSFIFSADKLEWHEARECCEIRGGELFSFSGTKEKEELYSELVQNGIAGPEKSLSFWSGGFRKIDSDSFLWSNYDGVTFPIQPLTEFCLKGVAANKSISFLDFPCDKSLPFICQTKEPTKCESVELRKFHILNSFRTYHYSVNYKLTWAEAVLCCRAKGLRLLSVISPQEGKMLARHVQRHPIFKDRHQGFYHGVWTSGRQHISGEYEFVAVKTRIRLDKSGKHHFLNGPWNGTCLQYVVDTRNSYLLSPIPCKSIRSFVCENPGSVFRYQNVVLQDIGNKYFYSKSKMTWNDADHVCRSHSMRLLNLKDHEEKLAFTLILQAHRERHHSPDSGLWVEAKPAVAPIMKNDSGPKNRIGGINRMQGKLVRVGKRPRVGPSYISFSDREQEQEALNTSYCNAIFASGNELKELDSVNCSESRAFLCENEDPEYGKCVKVNLKVAGQFLISNEEATWKEAKKCCEMTRRSLINVVDAYKVSQSDIYTLVKEDFNRPGLGFWTAGTGSIVPQKWIWAGSLDYNFVSQNMFYHNYTYFDIPTIVHDTDQCLEAFVDTKRSKIVLDHYDCDTPKPYICDRSEIKAPVPCSSINLERLEKTQYYYSKGKVSWPQAQECCQQRGLFLAEILNEFTNNRLYHFLSEVSKNMHNSPDFGLWVGLTSHIANHTAFTWINSRKTDKLANYSNWNPTFDLPVDPQLACANVYLHEESTSLNWRNVECSRKLRFICESEHVPYN